MNPFIAWRNFKLKGKPEKERAYRKYGIRQARLDLIQKWTKLCSRHYKETLPHKNKRIRLVMPVMIEILSFEIKSRPVKPGSRYHDEPVKIPKGQGYCTVCGERTRVMWWGCCMDFPGVLSTCPTSKSDISRYDKPGFEHTWSLDSTFGWNFLQDFLRKEYSVVKIT